jgi:hypothetical protein
MGVARDLLVVPSERQNLRMCQVRTGSFIV